MVVAGAPEENKSHVKDIALGINIAGLIDKHRIIYFQRLIIAVALSFRDEINELVNKTGMDVRIRTGFYLDS